MARGLDLGEKVLAPWPYQGQDFSLKAKTFLSRPRLFSQGQGQGQDLHQVSSRILEAKARPREQQDWWSVRVSRWLWTVLRPIKNLTLLTP